MPRTVPKAAVRLCPAKHRQGSRYRPGDACARCDQLEAERLSALDGAAEREEWRRALGPPPAVLEMRETESGRIIRHSIPRHLMRRKHKGARR